MNTKKTGDREQLGRTALRHVHGIFSKQQRGWDLRSNPCRFIGTRHEAKRWNKEYALFADAEPGAVVVAELDNPEVTRLEVTNHLLVHVLLLAGDLLKGGRQDRTVAVPVLVPPKATVCIEVLCVEQRRWRAKSWRKPVFGPCKDQMLPAQMRSELMRSQMSSLDACETAMADALALETAQSSLWNSIATENTQRSFAGGSSLVCLLDHQSRSCPTEQERPREDEPDDDVEDIPIPKLPPETRCQAVNVQHNDAKVAFEYFDRPTTFDRVWPRLFRSYGACNKGQFARAQKGSKFTVTLKDVDVAPSGGVGYDVRIANDQLLGRALMVDDCIVTMTVMTVP